MPKTPRFLPDRPLVIAILAFPDVQLLDVAGPLQVFATANDLARAEGRSEPYRVRVVSRDGGPIATSSGLVLHTDPVCPAGEPADTAIVAGGRGIHAAAELQPMLDWVSAQSALARRTASVCTGAFLLGAAGLLAGRRVVTHWAHCQDLARRYPDARVEADPIFVRDGALFTSAGVTAGIDLALALVEEDLGRPAALAVARHLVVFLKRPGGQAQFSAALALQAGGDRFGDLHAWIGRNLAADLAVPHLAERIGMSPRSFARHYRSATGVTPASTVERLRLEAARQLLAETKLPVKRIAARCGLGSEETLRRVFLRRLATTPGDYRRRFAASG